MSEQVLNTYGKIEISGIESLERFDHSSLKFGTKVL